MIYHTACGTGFRAGELSRLTPESFDLDAVLPVVRLPARGTKNKKVAVQPLPAGLAAELRPYIAGRAPGKPVWPGCWRYRAADMLKVDLAAAGIPYEVQGPDGPLYADFHALRHTYVTLLERAGASVKTAQALGRHSDPRLTMNRYAHADQAALAAAVDRLPLPGSGDVVLPPLPSSWPWPLRSSGPSSVPCWAGLWLHPWLHPTRRRLGTGRDSRERNRRRGASGSPARPVSGSAYGKRR